MKVRNGYVSNSSSSSFLVIFTDKSAFDNFKPFKGYLRFIKDLDAEDEKSAITFVKSEMEGKLYELKETLADRFREKYKPFWDDDYFMSNNAWNHIPWDFNYKDTDFDKKADMLREAGEKGIEAIEDCYSKLSCQKEAETFIRFLKLKGYKAVAVEYEDGTDDGAYMETRFMPFLKSCPEGDFMIYIMNCH